jgi:serine/threonine protein kinase
MQAIAGDCFIILNSVQHDNEGDLRMIETVPSGTVLHGRYRIERVLGSGGFGHVYLAIDLITSQQYALKEYLVTGASGQEQLKHEATVLSQLHHPNLPAFQDAFIERGRYYVVLNYIEGNDLTDLIRIARQRNDIVPIQRIMGWLLSICDAVLFLHSQHPPVIHRDIKPDNIRIMSNGTAVLVDLGNAKAAADGARTLFFIRHQGTPGYAPPEQYPGGSGTDARSDVYALGGTLYFALTSHEPPSVSTRNQSVQQGQPNLPTLQEVLASNPPEESPEANAARQFRLGVTKPGKPAPRHSRHIAQLGTLSPEVLNQLNRIIQRSMALKPKDRYQYVADFANDLKKVMAALPPSTQPPTTRQPDPHSTQPDLPMLYEALQAAKGNANQGPPDASSTSPVAAPSASPATSQCPRCNATLVPNASFCPVCGTPLSGGPRNALATSCSASGDAAGEQTMIITPQAKQAAVLHAAKPESFVPRPSAAPAASPDKQDTPAPVRGASSSRMQAMQVASFMQSNASNNHASHMPGASGASANGSGRQSGFSGFRMTPRILILLIVVLVVLLAVIAFFIISHGHHAHVQSGMQWVGLRTHAASHRRHFSLVRAALSTLTAARLWEHHAGVSLALSLA